MNYGRFLAYNVDRRHCLGRQHARKPATGSASNPIVKENFEIVVLVDRRRLAAAGGRRSF